MGFGLLVCLYVAIGRAFHVGTAIGGEHGDGGAVSADGDTTRIQTPDGQHVVIFDAFAGQADQASNVSVVHARTRKNIKSFRWARVERYEQPSFSEDGRFVVFATTASLDNPPFPAVWLWEFSSYRRDGTRRPYKLDGSDVRIYTLCISRDGRRVLAAAYDWRARIWDASSGSMLHVLDGHGGFVTSASFSPDGHRVVTTSDDRTARIWDANDGTMIQVLRWHQGSVLSASFSQDGHRVVTTDHGPTARIWDANTGITTYDLRHEGQVLSASFSQDGHRVVTASRDQTARIWDANNGAMIMILKGHEGVVRSARFSQDGHRVVTASNDQTARIWDANNGNEIHVLRGHESWVESASFSQDGRRVFTASYGDRTGRTWDASIGALFHPQFWRTK